MFKRNQFLLFFLVSLIISLNGNTPLTAALTDDLLSETAIVMDNADGELQGVSITGSWKTSTWKGGGQYFGADYIHDKNNGKNEKTVKFIPEVTAGDYAVFFRYTSGANRADNVPGRCQASCRLKIKKKIVTPAKPSHDLRRAFLEAHSQP